MPQLESVPNVSEGRDSAAVAAIAEAFASGGARVLDTHVDAYHHRAVITLVGDDAQLEAGLVAGIGAACRRIDLRRHDGVHPRVGAADVVPLVPLGSGDLGRAIGVARAVGRRVGDELGVPVFLYGALADGLRPAFFRRGGLGELSRRVDAGELAPAYGPRSVGAVSGAVLLGVRAPLVAFNVVLRGSFETAQEIAAAVRASSGGLPGVQALALLLGDGTVQVSTNLIDVHATPLHVLVGRIAAEAGARGAAAVRGELVGLVPVGSVARAAAAAGIARPLDADGIPTADALEAAASAFLLDRLDADRVLECHLRPEHGA
jgi:glutamate formiminotransferase